MATTAPLQERRELILLCAKEGKGPKAIAAELGLKVKTVQNTLYNARQSGALGTIVTVRTPERAPEKPNGRMLRAPVFARAESAKIVTCLHCHQVIVVE